MTLVPRPLPGASPSVTPAADPLIAALVRCIEALHRKYPDGPAQFHQEGLDGRATITQMSDRRRDPAA
jgi:hypothetical protein